MTPIKRRLTYFIRKNNNLRLRISWNGNSYDLSVGYNVEKEDSRGRKKWDGRRCITATTHGADKIPASTINKAVENLEDKINKFFYSYEIVDSIPTYAQTKDFFSKKTSSEANLFDAYNQFVIEKERYNQWAFNTVKTVKNICNLVKKFRPNLSFKDINDATLKDFVIWQQSHRVSNDNYKTKQAGYSNPVILKNCRIFKWFLEWAEEKGYIEKGIASRFRPQLKSVDKTVVFLTWDELLRMESFELDDKDLRKARDFFCFCCFTGLRYSDVAKLRRADVYREATPPYISVVTKKTSKRLHIELNKYALSILDKYAAIELPDDAALPVLSNQRMNINLHDAAEAAGLDAPVRIVSFCGSERTEAVVPKHEVLTTHAGRRTFIVNAFRLGIPAAVIMQWTGHADYKAMKPYIKIVDALKAENMERFNSFDVNRSTPEEGEK